MKLQAAGRTIAGVQLLPYIGNRPPSSREAIAKRQTDGVEVTNGAGERFYLHKPGLVDRDRFDVPPGTSVKVDGEAFTTTNRVVDWSDSFRDFIRRLTGI